MSLQRVKFRFTFFWKRSKRLRRRLPPKAACGAKYWSKMRLRREKSASRAAFGSPKFSSEMLQNLPPYQSTSRPKKKTIGCCAERRFLMVWLLIDFWCKPITHLLMISRHLNNIFYSKTKRSCSNLFKLDLYQLTLWYDEFFSAL